MVLKTIVSGAVCIAGGCVSSVDAHAPILAARVPLKSAVIIVASESVALERSFSTAESSWRDHMEHALRFVWTIRTLGADPSVWLDEFVDRFCSPYQVELHPNWVIMRGNGADRVKCTEDDEWGVIVLHREDLAELPLRPHAAQ